MCLADISIPYCAPTLQSNLRHSLVSGALTKIVVVFQARCDPNFVADARIPVQAYSNVIGHTTGETIPRSSSFVGGDDGYHPSVCLAVDADFANTEAGRGPMGTMLWRPFVAFNSGHYKYSTSAGGRCIVQVGVSADTTPHFGREQEVGEPAPGQSPGR